MSAPLVELANDHLRFALHADASADIEDARTGTRWRMGPVAVQEEHELAPGDYWLRTSRSFCEQYAGRFRGVRAGDAVRFTVLGRLGAEVGAFTCRYRLDGPWLEVEIGEVDESLPTLAFPTAIESERVLLPLGEGRMQSRSGGKFDRNVYRFCGNLNMRFFGGLRGEAGWIAVVDEGHADAGVLQTELALTPIWQKSLARWQGRRTVRYALTTGGYVGVAKAFRAWAQGHGLFRSLQDKIADRPALGNMVGGRHVIFWPLAATFRRKRFEDLCEPVPGRFCGRPEGVAVFTSYAEARDIIADCKELGMTRGAIGAGGWEHGGLDERHPDVWPPEPALGTLDELKALCSEPDPYLFYLCDQYADMYPCAPSFPGGLCLRRDGSPLPGGDWAGGQCYIAAYSAGIRYARRNWEQIRSLTPRAMYMDTTTATQFCESYEPGRTQTRAQDEALRQQFLSEVLGRGLVLGSENGADFGAPYVDFVHDNVSSHPPGEAVPLWPLVYHDGVFTMYHVVTSDTLDAPAELARRRLVTMLHGNQCSVSVGAAADWPRYRQPFVDSLCIDRWHARVGTSAMTDHRYLSEDYLVEQTTFASGAAIICNFAAEEHLVEGKSVPAGSYVIVG